MHQVAPSQDVIPQRAFKGRGKSKPTDGERRVPVVDCESDMCYDVPQSLVHVPMANPEPQQLKLCLRYSATGECDRGTRCNFIHVTRAVLDSCPKTQLHVNYAWHHVDQAPYSRLPPGMVIPVMRPNAKDDDAPFLVPSEYLYTTRGSTQALHLVRSGKMVKPATVCAHYYIGRMCRLGSNCHFIHYVTIDESSTPGQKARKRRVPDISVPQGHSQGVDEMLMASLNLGRSGDSATLSDSTNSRPSRFSTSVSISDGSMQLQNCGVFAVPTSAISAYVTMGNCSPTASVTPATTDHVDTVAGANNPESTSELFSAVPQFQTAMASGNAPVIAFRYLPPALFGPSLSMVQTWYPVFPSGDIGGQPPHS